MAKMGKKLARRALERNMPGYTGDELANWPTLIERAVAVSRVIDDSDCTGWVDLVGGKVTVKHSVGKVCAVHEKETR